MFPRHVTISLSVSPQILQDWFLCFFRRSFVQNVISDIKYLFEFSPWSKETQISCDDHRQTFIIYFDYTTAVIKFSYKFTHRIVSLG